MGVALRWGARQSCSARLVVCLRRRPFATLSIPVVRCMNANLQYRQSTLPPGFQILRLQRRTTVATRLRQRSPSVSGPSATRRALGQSRWATLWWSTHPGRGGGTEWVLLHVGAQRGPSVFLRRTLPTVATPAPSGVTMTSCCRHVCSRLVVASA